MSPLFPRPARRAAVALIVVGTIGSLAACSSSSDDAAAETDGLTPLTLQSSWINDAEFMGYYIAQDNGLYEDEGIDLTYLPGGPSVIPESSLLAGDADIAITSPDTTISAIADQDAPFVIIAAQYQQNPLGVVSLASSGIDGPEDLVGKTVAVPDVNRLAFDAMLTINDIDPSSVTVVPYSYDPTPLVKGEVDASLDFVTNVPFTISEMGETASSFTLYDAGYKIPNDTIVVTKDALENNREAIAAFLKATVAGWEENFVDTDAYPTKFENSWFEGTGRSIDNELFFNKAQQPLIESADGMFAMTDDTIQDTIDSLALVGITATPDMFDTSFFE
ncbi:ABC transporter substrate-binding protein [Amnibacterium flavum]|uniref:Thiamine pyrimidine synthase n=1 Tax=Amnibacterium flavum TaxID=2173173 RepID=A0A2V1HPG4_9MICO|nr:ABC transporter substrate-binding protein [Amnibacterium flavum]PVZ94438.1 myristoyl transferase [Amnibacterium flavum]